MNVYIHTHVCTHEPHLPLPGHPTLPSLRASLGFESYPRRLACDHYQAVPLSDGHHILFVDPQSGKLYLGCDAPIGGPIKLLRKIEFVPPVEGAKPRLYTSAFDMAWGARIVVVYGETIVLYCVPPDVCNFSRGEQKVDTWDAYAGEEERFGRNHWWEWWGERGEQKERGCVWPIRIRGQEVGVLRGVCEVAVQTRPDVTVWGFAMDSRCVEDVLGK